MAYSCCVLCCALFCVLLCYILIPGGLIYGYWALLYKASWGHGAAILSIIYFSLCIVFHVINLCLVAIALCFSGAAAMILIFLILWGVSFAIDILGLITSIHLLNSGADSCPTDGADCTLLVILFGLTVLSIPGALLPKTRRE
uniref:NADH dehydrogenase subunit 6 n=1 Tax=Panagrolaimus sp. PS1159 TaxID=55785 RepID=A0AC35F794_9BILA